MEREHKVQELSGILRFGSEFCEIYLERIKATHRRFANEVLQIEGLVEADKALVMLNNYKRTNPDQLGFVLFSARGEVIADTDALIDKPQILLFSDMPIRQFQVDKHREERLEFEPMASEISGESLILPLRYAVRDTDGELKYVVKSRLRLGLLQNFWKTALVPQESVLGLVHDGGYLINRYSANPGESVDQAFGKPSADALVSSLRQTGLPTNGDFQIRPLGADSEQLVIFRRLSYHPVTMFVSIPMSSIWMGWWNRVRVSFFLSIALIVVGGVAYGQIIKKRRAEHLVSEKQTEFEDVTQGILTAQEEERARLSHELHDEVGQSLTALKITLNRAQQNLANHEKASALLGSGQEMVEEMVGGIREIAYRLRPSELDQLGLVAALRSHIDKTIRPLFPNVALSENVGHQRFNHDLELCCFRIAQEALTNCLRHAKATQIDVSLDYQAPRLTLAIKDNGVGFDAACYSSAQAASGSLGLIGMRERVAANGGQLWIVALPEGGTQVTAHFHQIGEL
ncbi:histidine kinase [Propionivibrio limicola]|uniref:histidine kinase n=1 Tax=Propionivibrio limicola TaxID=167645 RepID=UPI0014793307|nr:histidine kinase [Propionivibrio limicola]